MDPEVFRAPDRLPNQILRMAEVGRFRGYKISQTKRNLGKIPIFMHIFGHFSRVTEYVFAGINWGELPR